MPKMDPANRGRTAAQFMRDNTEPTRYTKADLQAAVDYTDDAIDGFLTGWRAGLPAAFRDNSTPAAQANLLWAVVARRNGKYRAEEDS